MSKMPVFFHLKQLDFHPKYEWALGNKIKHPETTKRAQSIYKSLKARPDLYELRTPKEIPLSQLSEAHSYELVALYTTARSLEEGKVFYPSVFPQRMKAKPDPTNITHAGFYCFDSGTPLDCNTWLAASWSAACAYEAAMNVMKGESRCAYALSRPPGHHASKDTYGGYCYFNNAALAAKQLRKKGKIVILDIDFHHGNGTQELFYKDDKVFVISIHGDPRHYFPYYTGFTSEVGAGKGEGYNLNIILNDKCNLKEYIKSLKSTVIPAIANFDPDYLIISAGFDTYELDPIGNFSLKTEDYYQIGALLKKMNLPTVILQEGGYYAQDLGRNVNSFLSAFC